MRRRALDLYCGGGGAGQGLANAGFEVIGVDLVEQPDYPFEQRIGDAIDFVRRYVRGGWLIGLGPSVRLDLIWASPPCQRYSAATRQSGDPSKHPDLIGPTREALLATGLPFVIENVPEARRHLRDPIMLCGSMFGLGVVRHRYFETSWSVAQPPHPKHQGSLVTGEYVTVAGNGGVPAWTLKERERRGLPRHIPGEYSLERWQQAMGIRWLPRETLVEAIPPAYAKFIGRAFDRQEEVAA